jgi:hypothetical protein
MCYGGNPHQRNAPTAARPASDQIAMPASFVFSFRSIALIAVLSMCPTICRADPSDQAIAFFENRIRPVLVEHCYQCHSEDAEDIGGSLRLDSAAAMHAGGDSGPAIEPGDAEASVLIAAIRYESSEMPPSGRLPDDVIRDFETWINTGAVDPRTDDIPVSITKATIDLNAGRQFWSFRPLADVSVPDQVPGLSHNAIDRFINARLADQSIVPNTLADADVRLRRLAFDLTGLPPPLELQQRWQDDPSPSNWERIVDQMLASPAYAEHWARHWMDVARYADSNGSDFNATFHEAWRYRDYLIRSFAADQPFDQMIRQQVAGDLLPADDDDQRYDNVVATTFLMLGTKMLSERDKVKLELDVVDEQIDTIGRAFMGLTLGCARCHDHKFDPVPMQDYYALAGIFKSTVTLKGESQKYVSTWNRVELPTADSHRQAVAEHEQKEAAITKQLKAAEKHLKESPEDADAKSSVTTLKQELKQLQENAPEPLPVAMAVSDRSSDQISDSPLYIRGESGRPGEIVPRGFLQVCGDGDARIESTASSGRLHLADWLTDPNHPLVGRVFVNRIWMHLMGEGIVRTVDNFGQRGDFPSHPDLLDHLAGQFIRDGWHTKPLIREIVTSAAYQRSSDYSADAAMADPENRLLWRMPRRRLPAEAIRDAMLMAAGTLDRHDAIEPMKHYGVLVSKNNNEGATAPFDGIDVPKRSLYLPIVRGHLSPVMTALDMADPDLLTGQRRTTNVPGQALALANSPEVDRWAKQTAERLLAESKTFDERLNVAYRRCYGRLPRQADRDIAADFFADDVNSLDAWHLYVAALFAATEFRLLD